MEQYLVTGMSCAACSARVEKAVSKVPGVTACSVSLLTNSMGVEGNADVQAVIAAVEKAGYGAAIKRKTHVQRSQVLQPGSKSTMDGISEGISKGISEDMSKEISEDISKGMSENISEGLREDISNGVSEGEENLSTLADALADRETPMLKKRLVMSLGFLIILMYFSMGHMMWGWPLPQFFRGNPVAVGLVQLLLAGVIMVINQRFFVSGFKSLWHRAPNMDTLVALGSMAAFGYSTVALFAMTDAQLRGDGATAMEYVHELYFESAAMILALITVGKMLEARSKGKTTDALRALMKLAPKTANVLREGAEMTIPAEQVKKGDIFLVRPGENIPVDGVVLEGCSAVNEAALTGESIPVDKDPGDMVSAATLNQSGFLKCEATRVGEDTTLSQIIQMVSDAAATKAPIAKVADKVSGVFVPAVIVIALLTMGVWLLLGAGMGFAMARGISVLVISCPCALGLATPVAIMVGNGVGARNGILFKTAVSLEEAGKVQVVVLDKTGTITRGEPRVTDIIAVSESAGTLGDFFADEFPFSNCTIQQRLLELAYALEEKSEHPLAKAIVREAKVRDLSLYSVRDFQALPGNGLQAVLAGKPIYGGNEAFVSNVAEISEELQAISRQLAEEGKTPLFFAWDGKLVGIIAVADVIKEDSPRAVAALRDMGIQVVMLTGDNERTARAIGAQAGVDRVIAGVLPDGKEAVIRELQEQGKVAMVGDGINDAPALARADMGIAIGAGTDVAIDAADVVLMKSRLSDVPAAIRLSRTTLNNIHQNLFWAFFYNSIGIPLAAGVFVGVLGWELNPMFGAAAMSLSSFCVVTNALRLNFFKLHDASRDRGRRKLLIDRKYTANAQNIDSENVLQATEMSRESAIKENTISGNKIREYTIQIKIENEGEKENSKMEKTMKIEGMMCGHCQARVKKVLEKLDAVEEAVVSYETGTAVVTLKEDIDNVVLKKAVEDQDYTVTEIK